MMTLTSNAQVQRAPRADFRLEFRTTSHPGALACWLAVPQHVDPAARPLVAVHGIRRGADEQAALFAARAARLGRYVIAPFFDRDNWPAYQRLTGPYRSDLALISLLHQLQAERIVRSDQVDLFGFSAGAQFVHRFAMLHPHLVSRLFPASAGWYTFPDAMPYPYGLGVRDGRSSKLGLQMQAKLNDFLRLQIRVCVGAKDNVRDANTRSGRDIDRQQGRDRRARALRWAEALEAAAAARGITSRVKLTVLPGVGHDFRQSVTRGGLADLVLPDDDALRPLVRGVSLLGSSLSRRSMVGSLVYPGSSGWS